MRAWLVHSALGVAGGGAVAAVAFAAATYARADADANAPKLAARGGVVRTTYAPSHDLCLPASACRLDPPGLFVRRGASNAWAPSIGYVLRARDDDEVIAYDRDGAVVARVALERARDPARAYVVPAEAGRTIRASTRLGSCVLRDPHLVDVRAFAPAVTDADGEAADGDGAAVDPCSCPMIGTTYTITVRAPPLARASEPPHVARARASEVCTPSIFARANAAANDIARAFKGDDVDDDNDDAEGDVPRDAALVEFWRAVCTTTRASNVESETALAVLEHAERVAHARVFSGWCLAKWYCVVPAVQDTSGDTGNAHWPPSTMEPRDVALCVGNTIAAVLTGDCDSDGRLLLATSSRAVDIAGAMLLPSDGEGEGDGNGDVGVAAEAEYGGGDDTDAAAPHLDPDPDPNDDDGGDKGDDIEGAANLPAGEEDGGGGVACADDARTETSDGASSFQTAPRTLPGAPTTVASRDTHTTLIVFNPASERAARGVSVVARTYEGRAYTARDGSRVRCGETAGAEGTLVISRRYGLLRAGAQCVLGARYA